MRFCLQPLCGNPPGVGSVKQWQNAASDGNTKGEMGKEVKLVWSDDVSSIVHSLHYFIIIILSQESPSSHSFALEEEIRHE